jgi:hypothetical protein
VLAQKLAHALVAFGDLADELLHQLANLIRHRGEVAVCG